MLDVLDLDATQSSVTAVYHPGDRSLEIKQDGATKATVSFDTAPEGVFTVTAPTAPVAPRWG